MLDDLPLFTVTDLKQFTYCSRVVFYEQCLPRVRPRTYKMDAGRDTHDVEAKRAARRNLSQYGEVAGERYFDVVLTSAHLGLTGIVDEVVRTADGTWFPVDYKLAKQASPHYRVQLTAYALMLEEAESVAVEKGFIYLIPLRKMVAVPITAQLRERVLTLLTHMREMVIHELMPAPAVNPNYCASCEFRRFCNDV